MLGLAKRISEVLELLAQELDIPETALENATRSFKSVGTWLERPESLLSPYKPVIYPQGSVNLGTVVKPSNDDDEYDIDLVCEIIRSKADVSQEKLKKLVGIEVRAYAQFYNMVKPVDEGRRCWTLDYAEGARFHMDILPSLPDGAGFQKTLETHNLRAEQLHRYAIAITDQTHPSYRVISNDWPQSNPRGYAEWFKQRMLVQFNQQRRLIAESRRKQVHEVPEYAVKTPLQRAIQLLKRHRDIMLGGSDDKPISIIITTLAAQAYNNESDLVQALINILGGMSRFIEYRNDGVWIPNPVNPLENFADRWAEEQQRNETFFRWLESAQNDLVSAAGARDVQQLTESLSAGFGKRIVERSLQNFPSGAQIFPVSYSVPRVNESESRFQVSHCQSPPWDMSIVGEVRIGGKISNNNGEKWFDFGSDSKPLPKDRALKFKAFTKIPGPFQLYWQVTNTGNEAGDIEGGLRGNIFPGDVSGEDSMIRKEATAYKGMHWVRCFLVRNGFCIARSEPFIVNIG
jgi:hypothetical protein